MPPAKPDRDAALIAAYRRDPTVSMAQLGREFGITRERVRQIISSNGGTDGHARAIRRLTIQEHARICDLWSKGVPLNMIADLVGVARHRLPHLIAINGFDIYERYSAACGTTSGHQRHLNRREPPCSQCRQAHRERMRSYMRTGPSGTCDTCGRKHSLRPTGLIRSHWDYDNNRRCPGSRQPPRRTI